MRRERETFFCGVASTRTSRRQWLRRAVGVIAGLDFASVHPARLDASTPEELATDPIDCMLEIQPGSLLTAAGPRRVGPDFYGEEEIGTYHCVVTGPLSVRGAWDHRYLDLLPEAVQGPAGTAFDVIRPGEYRFTVSSAGKVDVKIPVRPRHFGLWPEDRFVASWPQSARVPEVWFRAGIEGTLDTRGRDEVHSMLRSHKNPDWYYHYLRERQGEKSTVTVLELSGDSTMHRRTVFQALLKTPLDISVLRHGKIMRGAKNLDTSPCATQIRFNMDAGLSFLRQGTCGVGVGVTTRSGTLGTRVSEKDAASFLPLNRVTDAEGSFPRLAFFVDQDAELVIQTQERNVGNRRPHVVTASRFQFPLQEGKHALSVTVLRGEAETQLTFWSDGAGWRFHEGEISLPSLFRNPDSVHRLVYTNGVPLYTE